ncbi:GtrA family protein [Halomicrobium salinisoli]|uniref:GtrA family protein n=1 Tax=Halomicrobium salinisoli TaxID=2878391 RepID=UPI001CEFEFE9|nr:GtrA family protein [Halomicrobium salinisoli]
MTIDSRVEGLLHRTRISQFVSVGIVGATIETTIVAILTTALGTSPLAAKAIGAEVSVTTMFVINDSWTFSDKGDKGQYAFIRRWGKSHLVRAVGLGVAFTVLYILTSTIQYSILVVGFDIWPTVANGVGIGIGMIVNYVAESLFTWNVTGVTTDG